MLFVWILLGIVVFLIVWLAFWSLVTVLVGMSRRQKEFRRRLGAAGRS